MQQASRATDIKSLQRRSMRCRRRHASRAKKQRGEGASPGRGGPKRGADLKQKCSRAPAATETDARDPVVRTHAATLTIWQSRLLIPHQG